MVFVILAIYTLIHVAISLVGIFTGIVVLFGMINSKDLPGWAAWFLTTTVLTSATGFFFPVQHIMPSHIVGIISLVVLAPAIYARYGRRMSGQWRWIYVVTAMIAEYLNVFVLVVQSFMKIPALRALAPTQTEPPFKITQLIVLLLFIVLTTIAAIRFHARPAQLAQLAI
jgi:hypothetical protein